MSVDPARYVIGPDAVIEDVDLDEEDVRLPDGTRLTEQRAGQFAREALAEIRRRCSSGCRRRSASGPSSAPPPRARACPRWHARRLSATSKQADGPPAQAASAWTGC